MPSPNATPAANWHDAAQDGLRVTVCMEAGGHGRAPAQLVPGSQQRCGAYTYATALLANGHVVRVRRLPRQTRWHFVCLLEDA